MTDAPLDRLTKFANWWMASRPLKPPLEGAHSRVGANSGLVLYRDAPFQVQIFICDPNSDITDHVHPDVDSIQVYIAGDMWFRKNGAPLVLPEHVVDRGDGVSQLTGIMHRVLPTDLHGAAIGPRGGTFITIQEWLNGVAPTGVHLNWDGPALSEAHGADLAG